MAAPRVSAFKPDQLWQQAREPMFWLDQALRVVWVNRAWEGLTGHSAVSLVGQTCAAYGPTESGEPADVAASFVPPPEAVAGQPSGSLTVILHASGERLWRRVEFWPFRDQSGALILALDREDVVLPGDLALRKAVRSVYRLDHLPLPAEVTAIAEPWRPYRSLATSYLFTAGPEGSDEAQAAAQTGDTADQVAPREG